jgi:DNA-directed RNA polymerase subunit L
MEIKYIKDEKNEIEVEIDNLTVAELVRAYLVEDDKVDFAAWRREHPTKNPVLKVVTNGKTARKAVQDAIKAIEKELDSVVEQFKKEVK